MLHEIVQRPQQHKYCIFWQFLEFVQYPLVVHKDELEELLLFLVKLHLLLFLDQYYKF